MPDTSIVISARDNYSTAINTMRNATRNFASDADSMKRTFPLHNTTT